MSDCGDSTRIYFRKRDEQVHSPNMIHDSFHGAAFISASIDIPLKIGFVVAEAGIVRRQSHIAALGEFRSIVEICFAAQTGRLILSYCRRLMKAERSRRVSSAIGDQKPCVDNGAWLGGKRDLLANVFWKLHLFQRLDIQRGAVIDVRQRSHHLRNGTEVLSRDSI